MSQREREREQFVARVSGVVKYLFISFKGKRGCQTQNLHV